MLSTTTDLTSRILHPHLGLCTIDRRLLTPIPLRITTDHPRPLYCTFSFVFLAFIKHAYHRNGEVLGKEGEAHARSMSARRRSWQEYCRPWKVTTPCSFLAEKSQMVWYLATDLLRAASGGAYDRYFYCSGRQHNLMIQGEKGS